MQIGFFKVGKAYQRPVEPLPSMAYKTCPGRFGGLVDAGYELLNFWGGARSAEGGGDTASFEEGLT